MKVVPIFLASVIAAVALVPTTRASGRGYPAPAMTTQRIKAVEANNGFAFSPARVTVKLGTRVVWVNSTNAPHTVTFYKAGMLNKQLPQGKTVSFTAKKRGTFKYHCVFHPGMVAVLIVK